MTLEQWSIIYLKKIFMGKETINILTVFSISHKKWCQNFSKMNCYPLS